MFSKKIDSGKSALDKFEAARLQLRKKYFAKREIGGLSFAWGQWLVLPTPKPLDPADHTPLADAIRQAFPSSNPIHWAVIARGYRELFKGLPEEDAVLAVSKHFANPGDAMRAGVISNRRFVGFAEIWP